MDRISKTGPRRRRLRRAGLLLWLLAVLTLLACKMVEQWTPLAQGSTPTATKGSQWQVIPTATKGSQWQVIPTATKGSQWQVIPTVTSAGGGYPGPGEVSPYPGPQGSETPGGDGQGTPTATSGGDSYPGPGSGGTAAPSPTAGTPDAYPGPNAASGTPGATPSSTPSPTLTPTSGTLTPSSGTPSATVSSTPTAGTPGAVSGTPSLTPTIGTPGAASATPSVTPTKGTLAAVTGTPSVTPTMGTPPASSGTSSATPTPTGGTPGASPTVGPSATPTPSLSPTPSPSPTKSPTPTTTPTRTPTITLTPTLTFTPTPIPIPPWISSELQATDPDEVELASGDVQLVMFFAFWDGASQAMAPLVHSLEEQYQDEMNFVYLDVDDPANTTFKRTLGYRRMPHFFLLDYQGRVLRSWQGYVDVEDFVIAFEAALLP